MRVSLFFMPTPATMEYIADLVVRRALADAAKQDRPISELLAESYPFSERDKCDHIWYAALARHGVEEQATRTRAAGASSA